MPHKAQLTLTNGDHNFVMAAHAPIEQEQDDSKMAVVTDLAFHFDIYGAAPCLGRGQFSRSDLQMGG